MSLTKKAVSFTLRADLLSWVDLRARSKRWKRSRIIEKALEAYKKQEIQEQLDESFRRMKNDEDMKQLAEMGLDDFQSLTDSYDSAG